MLLARGVAFGAGRDRRRGRRGAASAAVPEPVLLGAFAVLMLAVGTLLAVRQWRGRGRRHRRRARPRRPALDDPIITFSPTFACQCPRALKVLVTATAVGLLTGFLGVGGGFLVVPALLLALSLPMEYAAGTSLVVITLTSGVALPPAPAPASPPTGARRSRSPRPPPSAAVVGARSPTGPTPAASRPPSPGSSSPSRRTPPSRPCPPSSDPLHHPPLPPHTLDTDEESSMTSTATRRHAARPTPTPTASATAPARSAGSASWVTHHRRLTAVVWLLLIVGLGAFAPKVEANLSGAGWQADGSESVAVRELAQESFGGNASSAIQVVVHSTDGPVTEGAGSECSPRRPPSSRTSPASPT